MAKKKKTKSYLRNMKVYDAVSKDGRPLKRVIVQAKTKGQAKLLVGEIIPGIQSVKDFEFKRLKGTQIIYRDMEFIDLRAKDKENSGSM